MKTQTAKIKLAIIVVWFFPILILLLTSCGKSDSQSTSHESRTANLVSNGSFEQGTSTPTGWHTKNQFLNDVSGWVTEESHSGKHSLKIENVGGTDAYWQGEPIVFDKPAQGFEASIWIKAKDITENKGKFALSFDVSLKRDDGQEIKRRVFIDLPKTNHDWEQTKAEVLFTENIVSAVPFISFSDLGAVYADNLSIKPLRINLNNENVLFDSNTNGTFEKNKNVKLISDKDGMKTYEMKGPQGIESTDFIAIEPDKPYQLSGMFKSEGNKNNKMYFGYASYTQDKKFITPESVTYIENTETELAKPCSKEDTQVYIKDGKSWVAAGHMCIAFGIDNSGKFHDLPNFNVSQLGINKIQRDDDCWKIYLTKLCGVNYPADTKIREHRSGAGYNYMASSDKLPDTWTVYGGINYGNTIYPEARYVKIVILGNYGQTQDALMYFKDIKMKKSYATVKYIP